MSKLTARERELVAIGAALASNCIPCIEYHIQEARKAGLSDAEIDEAVTFADKIKRVPAEKVLDAASRQLAESSSNDSKIAPSASCTSTQKAKKCL